MKLRVTHLFTKSPFQGSDSSGLGYGQVATLVNTLINAGAL